MLKLSFRNLRYEGEKSLSMKQISPRKLVSHWDRFAGNDRIELAGITFFIYVFTHIIKDR